MANSVVFIWGSESSFIATTIQKKIQEREIEVNMVKPKMSEVTSAMANCDLILLNVTDEILDNYEMLIFIRDYCMENDKPLCLIGDPKDTSRLKGVIKEKFIAREFLRPIDVKQVSEEVVAVLNSSEAEKKHILIVDDAPVTLRTVKSWFEGKYEVSIANSAAMAISFLSRTTPDLILLDYEMPNCNGTQFLEMIHSDISMESIPVIFLTGHNDNASVSNALGLKPAGYLLKSMDAAKIVEYVDNFFIRQRQLKLQQDLK